MITGKSCLSHHALRATMVALLAVWTSGALPTQAATDGVQVTALRCEYLDNPLGIDVTRPRLSWILVAANPEERGKSQSAYRVLASSSRANLDADVGDLWDTGKVMSGQSIQLHYGGRPLDSRQQVWWKVMVWDENGRPSPWSEPASWSMGLLHPGNWKGRWIGIRGGEQTPEEFQGAEWIGVKGPRTRSIWYRGTFELTKDNPPSYALLAAEGYGAITVYVNGNKIVPFFGTFPAGYAAQNITQMLHLGENVIAIQLDPNAERAAIIAGITLDMSNGAIEHIQSDRTWVASTHAQAGWEKPEFADANWERVDIVSDMVLPYTFSERTRLPARMLRKQFVLSTLPRKATVYISGLGYSELYLNGKKISDDVLGPALSDYDKRVFYRTYDVTAALRKGENAIGILLGNGRFYAPRRNIPVYTRNFGYPEALAQLEVEYMDGHRVIVATDGTWAATAAGPIRANNVYDGEVYDARMEQTGWSSPGFDSRKWGHAELMQPPIGALHAQMIDPIKVMRELHPVRITEPEPGVYVFDMNQNMVGWTQLHVSGPRGTRVSLRYAETLQADGMLYTDNLRSARQTDVYILKGSGAETYEPRFTSHGFRYVELRGYPGTPTLSALTGKVVNDSMPENADFASSNATINHIYRNMIWGIRGNYHSIPTDCPQRDERQGWLGDRSSESKGESFIFQVEPFYSKWIQDIEDTMDSKGRINDVAPAYWPFYNENVVWPASFFIVADMLHQQYADDDVIRSHYSAMQRWVAHMRTLMRGNLMPVDVYGDWCAPPKSLHEIQSDDPATKTAPEILGTTYFYYVLHLMSKFAFISGHPSDAKGYDSLAASMKKAFNAKYFNATTSQYGNGTQTSSILPLAFGLVPRKKQQAVYEALIKNIEIESKDHVGTGLVGGQWLMRTLAGGGRPDVAYRIASQTTYPSWGYMISQGATTIWELWNGNTAAPAMNSRNHLMLLGDFSTWLYEDLAGIKSDPATPGFRHILIHPEVPDGLAFVRASVDSPYGKISTHWRRANGAFTLEINIPVNATATVSIPAESASLVMESGKSASFSQDVRFLRCASGRCEYEVGSGKYVFTSTEPYKAQSAQLYPPTL